MNRGIRISISNFNEGDIKKASLTIAESYDKNLVQGELFKHF